jgi:BrxA
MDCKHLGQRHALSSRYYGWALKVPESRIIADLLLRGLDETGWQEAIYGQNVLQTRSPKTAARLALLLRGRLTLMEADLWKLDVCFINSSPVELPYACTVEGDRRHVQNVGAGG